MSHQSWRQVTAYLTKQARKFATGDSADEVRSHFIKEALIQMMPIETAAYVRERAPKTPEEAADLAANHFLSHGVNQFNWEGQRPRRDKEKFSLSQNKFDHNQSFKPSQPISKFKGDTHSHKSFEPRTYSRPYDTYQSPTPQVTKPSDKTFSKPNDSYLSPTPQRPNDKTFKQHKNFNPKIDKSKIECFKCHQLGHFSNECTVVATVCVPSMLKLSSKPLYKPGKIGDKSVQVLMDSGASFQRSFCHLTTNNAGLSWLELLETKLSCIKLL